MILGQTICVVGAGMLTRIGVGTNIDRWATYLVITGIGMGMSMQLSYTTVQTVLRYLASPQKKVSSIKH